MYHMEHALSSAHDSAYSLPFIQFPLSENGNIRHFSLSYNYETYADRFVCLCGTKYLMFVFTSLKMSLIRKVKWILFKTVSAAAYQNALHKFGLKLDCSD